MTNEFEFYYIFCKATNKFEEYNLLLKEKL